MVRIIASVHALADAFQGRAGGISGKNLVQGAAEAEAPVPNAILFSIGERARRPIHQDGEMTDLNQFVPPEGE